MPAELTVTSVRISRDQLEKFKRVAAENQRTVSQELRWMIHQANDAHSVREREQAA